MKKVTHITYGLFLYRGIHFYRNLKDIPILIKRLCFLLKHGYTDLMWWDTSDWFISGMRDALLNYRHNRKVHRSLYLITAPKTLRKMSMYGITRWTECLSTLHTWMNQILYITTLILKFNMR